VPTKEEHYHPRWLIPVDIPFHVSVSAIERKGVSSLELDVAVMGLPLRWSRS
jgi:hypothetical protein